jgi:hypothetical protein
MKRFLFAVTLVALSASVGSAEDVPTAPAPTPVVMGSAPMMMGATPVYETGPVQPARRGLFGRLRNRNGTMSYSSSPMMMTAPTMAPVMTPGMAPTPMPPAAPMTMPGTKPAGTTMAPGTVVPATGNVPPGIYTTTDGMVVQVGGTQMMSTPMTAMATEQPARRGLFGRLRN